MTLVQKGIRNIIYFILIFQCLAVLQRTENT